MTQMSTSNPSASVPGSFRLIFTGISVPGLTGSRGRGFSPRYSSGWNTREPNAPVEVGFYVPVSNANPPADG